jgi:hypothetical protein
VDNRYPFDWSTVLLLQGLQLQQQGLKVDLGAPSSWCIVPAAAAVAAGSAAGSSQGNKQGSSLPAGWSGLSAAAEDMSSGGSDGGCAAAAADSLSIASEDLCGVCLDAPNVLQVNGCKHQLCVDCYKQLVRAAAAAAATSSRRQLQPSDGQPPGCAACPFCRAPMTGFRYSAWVQEEERLQGLEAA